MTADTQDRMRTLTAGYTMHVPKPVGPGKFTTIVASLAARPGQGARGLVRGENVEANEQG